MCSLENLYFKYDEIISTSKLPFHNPLVMNFTTFVAYFSLDYENCPFTKFSWKIILHIYCIYSIHISYMVLDLVYFTHGLKLHTL